MADSTPFYLFKELRLGLEPAIPDSVLTLRLPAHGTSNHSSRAPQRRARPTRLLLAEDEGQFGRKYLATSSSVYFRHNTKYPRSFLWRVLDDAKTLSIQSVDLIKGPELATKAEASIILRLVFPNAIAPAGVILSDSVEHDFFNVFVLTTSNDLYTLTLRSQYFTRSSAPDGDVTFFCKTFLPSSFSFRYPHRLAALSPQELLVSLHDGGILRLSRKPEDDGSFWTETIYNEGGWGASFRSLLPWQGSNTIRYGNARLEQSTVSSIAFSPDNSYLFTVSLNHTLKAWNLANGRIDTTKDLLNQERQPQDTPKYLLDPSQSDLISIIDRQIRVGDLFYVLTYSPIGAGQFKFWAAKTGANNHLELEDLCPDMALEPPAPLTEIWTLAQFRVTFTALEERMALWILWKNNTSYRVQHLEFDLRSITIEWNEDFWVTATTETLRDHLLPEPSDNSSHDVTDQWLEYLFYPGRFTRATLGTSLSIYEQNLKTSVDPSSWNGKSLEERLCSAIAATVTLGRNSESTVDFEQYRIDVDSQWRRFYRIAAELDKQRGEANALVFDKQSDLPWIVTSDGVTLLRDCSGTELLYHNRLNQTYNEDILQFRGSGRLLKNKRRKDTKEMAGLINAACTFRETLSEQLLQTCQMTAELECLQDSSFSVPNRIRSFYDRCGFATQISDEDYNQLISAIDAFGGLKALDTDLFEAVIDTISSRARKPREEFPLASFGSQTFVKGAQELIHLNSIVLFDLLVLIVFLEIEVDREEESVEWFDSYTIFFRIITEMKAHEVLRWLAKSSRVQVPKLTTDDPGTVNQNLERGLMRLEVSDDQRNEKWETVLQDLFVDCFSVPWPPSARSPSSSLTNTIRTIFIRVFATNETKQDTSLTLVLCNLLKTKNIGLASDFVRYLPSTPWASYLRGRVHLCKREYSMAALQFKKSAYGLHTPALHKDRYTVEDTDGLLDLVEIRDLHGGPLGYYRHVIDLFEKDRVYSYATDFAKIALQFTKLARSNEGMGNIVDDILSRLFYSSLQVSRLEEAYTAVLQMEDHALKKRAIRDLVAVMCEKGDTEDLINLPFIGLQDEVDEQLAFHCQNTLNINTGPPFHKLLYAWRMKRHDLRGAASILYERLQRLQTASTTFKDPQNSPVTEGYLALINILSLVDPAQAWILTSTRVPDEAASSKRVRKASGTSTTLKRKAVTLDDIRKEYQSELDRIAKIDSNQFSFIGGMEDDAL